MIHARAGGRDKGNPPLINELSTRIVKLTRNEESQKRIISASPRDRISGLFFVMDEFQFKTLRELAKDGTLSQRDLSRKMGLSLGRVNYLVNELLKAGYLKASRFKNSRNKIAYMYALTPEGMSVKLTHTYNFLHRKLDEYHRLKEEIEALRQETDVLKEAR